MNQSERTTPDRAALTARAERAANGLDRVAGGYQMLVTLYPELNELPLAELFIRAAEQIRELLTEVRRLEMERCGQTI